MSEDNKVECSAPEECSKKKTQLRKKRDIFRFNGSEDLSIDLGHVYKIVRKEKRITFQTACPGPSADYIEFESEEAAKNGYDHILAAWASDVLE